MSMVGYTGKELNEKFINNQDDEIKRFILNGAMSDEQLDLSDIPEITDWSHTVRLDADVLAWLKAQGKGYQTRMNQILREAMIEDLKNHP